MDYNKKWSFAVEVYMGDGGFDDKTYIDKHTRESDDKYKERKKITDYSNIFVQKVGRYVGYLYKKPPIRASKDKMIQAIFNDADNAGNSMDVFMSGFSKTAKVRGVGLVLIDMPTEIPKTQKEQLESRQLPYFVDIAPETVTEYKMDKFGKFEYIAYTDVLDESSFGEEKKTGIIRYYDQTKWQIFNEDGKIIKGADHGLGVCPILYVGENGNYPDVGEFTQVSNLAKRHLNLESEMDDIMRGQTFSILTLQADNPSDVVITLSTDNAIKYGAGMNAPSFIAPDVSPSATYESKISAIEERMNDITYDISTTLSAESGIALDIKFQGLNGSLANFAMRLEDFEIRAFEIIQKYLKKTPDFTILYPQSFDITDLSKEINTLDSIKRLGYSLPTYEATKLRQIIANDLSGIDDNTLAQINAEIEDGLKEEI